MRNLPSALVLWVSLVSASPVVAHYEQEPVGERVASIVWKSAKSTIQELPPIEISVWITLWNAIQALVALWKIQTHLATYYWPDEYLKVKDDITFMQRVIKKTCRGLWEECLGRALESSLMAYYEEVLLRGRGFDRDLFQERLQDAAVELFGGGTEHPAITIQPVTTDPQKTK